MSIQAVAWAISQRLGSPTGKVLLMCLANYANVNGEIWAAQTKVAAEAELSRRTTIIWLKKLEKAGYIKRQKRYGKDGYRTTDLITVQLDKLPEPLGPKEKLENNESSLCAEFAHSDVLGADEGTPKCISRSETNRQIHSKEPLLEPLKEPSSGASARGEGGFKKLWDEWPSKERPDKIKAAKWTFDRLTAAEQSSAVQQAKRFRRRAKARKEMALMIPYLKQRQFEDLANGPEINTDGKFIITPDRLEWPAWREYLRSKYSEAAVERLEARNSFFADDRWPPKLVLSVAEQAA